MRLPLSSAYAEARTNCLGYPRGRLLVVKHRQLARQVGAFSGFASESSADLDNMIFSRGSTFIFGSWAYEADDSGKLQSRLLEDSDHHEDFTISTTTINQLARRLERLAVSDQTQIPRPFTSDPNSGSATEMEHHPSSFYDSPSSFLLGLRNAALVYQEFNSEYIQSSFKKSGPFPSRIHGVATSYQT